MDLSLNEFIKPVLIHLREKIFDEIWECYEVLEYSDFKVVRNSPDFSYFIMTKGRREIEIYFWKSIEAILKRKNDIEEFIKTTNVNRTYYISDILSEYESWPSHNLEE